MRRFMMAAVALICVTMTSVVFTSCGSDDDTPSTNKEYTLYAAFMPIQEGELSQEALNYLSTEFNQEVRNIFRSEYEAKSKVDEIVQNTLSVIKNSHLYAPGCEYKIYYKMYDTSKNVVYSKTIYVIEDNYKVE
jgi:hypothetical protein